MITTHYGKNNFSPYQERRLTHVNFNELTRILKSIPFDEQRKESEGYFEFVILSGNLLRLYPILEKYFGVPFKPAGVMPSLEAQDYAKQYGGIQKQQTLYYMKRAGLSNCAMIWPWNDSSRATVKIAQGRIPQDDH